MSLSCNHNSIRETWHTIDSGQMLRVLSVLAVSVFLQHSGVILLHDGTVQTQTTQGDDAPLSLTRRLRFRGACGESARAGSGCMTGQRMLAARCMLQWLSAELDSAMHRQLPYCRNQVPRQKLPAAWAARCLPSRIAQRALHQRLLVDACPQCSVTERWTAQLHASEEAWSCNRLLHGFTWHDRMPISVAGRQWLGLRLFSRPRAEIQSYLQVWAPCDFLIIIAQSLHSRSMRPFLDTQRADGTSMAYMRLKASVIALQTASHRRQLSPGAHQPMSVCSIIPNSFSIPACPSHAWT